MLHILAIMETQIKNTLRFYFTPIRMAKRTTDMKCGPGPCPNQEAVCNWHLLAKTKPVFSSGVSLGILTILQGWLYTQKELTDSKQNSMVFLCFDFIWKFYLIGLWPVCFNFIFVLVVEVVSCFVGFYFSERRVGT